MQILFSILILAAFFALCYGWGSLLVHLLHFPKQFLGTIWLGWIFLLGILQFLHLLFPINQVTLGLLFALGLAFGLFFAVPFFHKIRQKDRDTPPPLKQKEKKGWLGKGILAGFFVLAASALLVARSMASPYAYDAGLYYFQAIKWNHTFAIVPGLGNLIGQFAFNSSLFLFAALLDFSPYYKNGFSLINIFLYLLSLGSCLSQILPLLRQPALLRTSHPLRFWPALLLLPYLLHLPLLAPFVEGLTSAAPDIAVNLIEITLFLLGAKVLYEIIEQRKKTNSIPIDLLLFFLLASSVITIKLSALVFAASCIVFISALCLYSYRSKILPLPLLKKTIFLSILVSSFLLLVWSLGTFLLSGYFLYPSPLLSLPVDWRIPKEHVVNIKNWIYSWARQPGVSWEIVLADWNWFRPWLKHFLLGNFLNAAFPLLLSVLNISVLLFVGAFLLAWGLAKRKAGKKTTKDLLAQKNKPIEKSVSATKSRFFAKAFLPAMLLACFPVPSLLFWFFTAPATRFALPLFAIFSAASTLTILWLIFLANPKDAKPFSSLAFPKRLLSWLRPLFPYSKKFMIAVFLWTNLGFFVFIYLTKGEWKKNLSTKWQEIPKTELHETQLPSGASIFYPKKGDQCWTAPLPCVARKPANLRLRMPPKISRGFRLSTE